MRGMMLGQTVVDPIFNWQKAALHGLVLLGIVAAVVLILWLFKSPKDVDRH
jgi:hypothetical protein